MCNVSIVTLRRNYVLEFIRGEQEHFTKSLGSNVVIANLGNEQAFLGKSIKGL